ncbi:hypothetical protein C8J57DRAFT_317147 [Mycena rebaudengoi]|nr:hypothetical protein C8J57DRAFT_317147 [Mycena rebaudengoi]
MLDLKGKGKAPEEPPTAEPENPQLIRITSNGKITSWVAFALDFLEKHEDIPIVLHTLPAPPKPASQPTLDDALAPAKAAASRLSVVTSTIPRLISVVEIIKREYVKKLELQHLSTLTGLHQYNEMGTLEDLGLGSPEPQESEDARRSEAIAAALEGKTHLKLKHTPFMKITLSRTALVDLPTTTTYQPPLMRTLSKSAKARAKRRERKATDGVEVD